MERAQKRLYDRAAGRAAGTLRRAHWAEYEVLLERELAYLKAHPDDLQKVGRKQVRPERWWYTNACADCGGACSVNSVRCQPCYLQDVRREAAAEAMDLSELAS